MPLYIVNFVQVHVYHGEFFISFIYTIANGENVVYPCHYHHVRTGKLFYHLASLPP